MKKLKKVLCAALAACLIALLAAGCGRAPAGPKKLHIVTTIYPLYDWCLELLGDVSEADITLLSENGVDMHSFQPSAADIVKIATADLFIYVGGESDEWVDKVLDNTENPARQTVSLLEVLGDAVKTEEALPGVAEEEEEEEEADEHVWLSLRNARVLCAAISESLTKLIPEEAEQLAANLAAYDARLEALDAVYLKTLASSEKSPLLFADRFPFRYLVDDYDLSYYAAFPGCSSETEASFETVIFLAERLKEEKISALFILDGGDDALARTILETAGLDGLPVLTLHSLQSTSLKDRAAGVTYLGAMEQNLSALESAFSSK